MLRLCLLLLCLLLLCLLCLLLLLRVLDMELSLHGGVDRALGEPLLPLVIELFLGRSRCALLLPGLKLRCGMNRCLRCILDLRRRRLTRDGV